MRARLRPLIGPVLPGGFDFARNGYFMGFGATGFALGRASVTPAPAAVPIELRVLAAIDKARRTLTERIRAVLPGENGAVAAALVTGMRDQIPGEVNEAMRVSGLAHVLAISGLHMVLVVGTIFGIVRGGLALVPGFALRRPVKKWAAAVALLGALGYLILSGAAVSTQRAFVMIAVVLLGVLADRPALTLRTLAAAAVVLLVLAPESILTPSFQMSFAATLALVALFERFAPFMARPPSAGSGVFARTSESLGRWLILGAATSLAAGLATGVFAAFHFHRVAPYGLVSNVLAMPVLSFVIMPAGLVSVLLVPFGYDALGWQVMGKGIELMLAVARWVAELPGAEGRVMAFGAGAVLLATGGLLLLAVPVSKLRYAGVPLLLLAFLFAASAPRPDVLVDAENGAVAVRGNDGRLAILDARKNRFTSEMWLAADADGRPVTAGLGNGFRCDQYGCTARLHDGTIVAVARTREALLDDCRDAGLIVTTLDVPAACKTPVIDRRTLATTGAIALRRVDGKWIAEPARSPLANRPWFGRARAPDAVALSRFEVTKAHERTHETRALEIDDVTVPDLPEAEDVEDDAQ
jgi:competence protein ComEC